MFAHTRASSLLVCLLWFGLAPTTMLVAHVGTPTVTTTTTSATTPSTALTTNDSVPLGVTTTTSQVIEWDVPQSSDFQPGAVAVDGQGKNVGLWFVTRDGSPRVLRLQP